MDGLESLMKQMLAGCEVCAVCGCDLIINKTFYKQCFSCDAILWKDYKKEEV